MIFDKDEAVTLVVGEEPGKYELLVHAGRISANSEFFKTALKREWLEGQTRTINMPADDWRTMTDYLNFAYSGELLTTYFTDPTLSGRPDRESCRLAKLYVLGKRLLDDVVHNAVARELFRISDLTDTVPGRAVINILYEGTPEGDHARHFVVDLWVDWASSLDLDSLDDNFDQAFTSDLARALFQKVELVENTPSDDYWGDISWYLV